MKMTIKRNIKLSQYCTFHVGGEADYFCEAHNEKDIKTALEFSFEKRISFLRNK